MNGSSYGNSNNIHPKINQTYEIATGYSTYCTLCVSVIARMQDQPKRPSYCSHISSKQADGVLRSKEEFCVDSGFTDALYNKGRAIYAIYCVLR